MDFRGFDSIIILIIRGGDSHLHSGFPGMFESSNLSMDNGSRKIGRTPRLPPPPLLDSRKGGFTRPSIEETYPGQHTHDARRSFAFPVAVGTWGALWSNRTRAGQVAGTWGMLFFPSLTLPNNRPGLWSHTTCSRHCDRGNLYGPASATASTPVYSWCYYRHVVTHNSMHG